MDHRLKRPSSASKVGVPRTTGSRYRKHTLFSRPYYDENLGVWMSYASVVQDVLGDRHRNNTYHHEVKDGNQSFEREEQALCFGFIIGRSWIDEHLSHAAVKSKAMHARCAVLLLLSMQLPDLAVRDIEDRFEVLRSSIKELLAS